MNKQKANKILLQRLEIMLDTKGLYINGEELSEYAKRFPDGILNAIWSDSTNKYDYWRRGGKLIKLVNNQIDSMMYPPDFSRRRVDVHKKWSLRELERILFFLQSIGKDVQVFDDAAKKFIPLGYTLFNDLIPVLSDRYEWRAAVAGFAKSSFLHDLAKVSDLVSVDSPPQGEEWFRVISDVLLCMEKLIVLSQIRFPLLREHSRKNVVFRYYDDVLIESLRKVLLHKDFDYLAEIFRYKD